MAQVKTKLSPEAVALLQRVKQHILEDPLRIAMSRWLDTSTNPALGSPPPLGYPSCNTVGCIGGWVECLTYGREAQDTSEEAENILDLSDADMEELFYPEHLLGAKNQQTPEHAHAVAAHIDKFIADHT